MHDAQTRGVAAGQQLYRSVIVAYGKVNMIKEMKEVFLQYIDQGYVCCVDVYRINWRKICI